MAKRQEKIRKDKKEKEKKKQDQMPNRCNIILQWLQMENWLNHSYGLTDSLSYPQSRDAIASKK